jgi:hypothetical protein
LIAPKDRTSKQGVGWRWFHHSTKLEKRHKEEGKSQPLWAPMFYHASRKKALHMLRKKVLGVIQKARKD